MTKYLQLHLESSTEQLELASQPTGDLGKYNVNPPEEENVTNQVYTCSSTLNEF